jgi:RNA polymerase sigma factor (sigma-70 family)
MPDARLIADAQAGDATAFDALMTARLDRTYRTARAILGNEPDARDVVQDAWLSIWRRLPSLREAAAFEGWVYRIVLNACRSRLRDRAKVREIPMAGGFEPPDQSLGSRPEDVAEREIVERAFERLNPDSGRSSSFITCTTTRSSRSRRRSASRKGPSSGGFTPHGPRSMRPWRPTDDRLLRSR